MNPTYDERANTLSNSDYDDPTHNHNEPMMYCSIYTVFAWALVLAQTPATSWDWGSVAEKYGVLGLFCLYLIFRGEKKLDAFTTAQEKTSIENAKIYKLALDENTKAIKVMTEAFAQDALAKLMELATSEHVHPSIQKEAVDTSEKFKEIIKKSET